MMLRLVFAAFLALLWPALAGAQPVTILPGACPAGAANIPPNGPVPLYADSNGNLCTSATTTAGPLVAGSAIVGKVGIDQTTPGTTNGVQVNAALPAGANVIGKTSIDQTTPGTTNKVAITGNTGAIVDGVLNGSSPANALAAHVFPNTTSFAALVASANGAVTVANVKASAGNVFGVSCAQTNASITYLQFYNTAGTPTLGTSVVWFLAIPASSTLNVSPGAFALANFTAGIGIGASTTPTGVGTPGVAPSCTVFYK